MTAYLKGFGCRPEHERSIRYKAGVRKPRKKEPAGKRETLDRLWGFVAAAALPADGFVKIAES
jgi:hypothetical protein